MWRLLALVKRQTHLYIVVKKYSDSLLPAYIFASCFILNYREFHISRHIFSFFLHRKGWSEVKYAKQRRGTSTMTMHYLQMRTFWYYVTFIVKRDRYTYILIFIFGDFDEYRIFIFMFFFAAPPIISKSDYNF